MTPCLFGIENELGLVSGSNGTVRPAPAEMASAIINDVGEHHVHVPSPPPERRLFLANGACVYTDIGGHPEIATAECCDPIDLAAQTIALRRMLAESADTVSRVYGVTVRLIANNLDYALGGAKTFGNHLNVFCSDLPFDRAATQLTPLLVAMPVVAGSGRVSFAAGSAGFELSQRAGFMATAVGKHTTDSRGMITRKDESLADHGIRIHVISLDTVVSSWQLALVPSILALSLKAIGTGEDIAGPVALLDPVESLRTVSCDPSLGARLPLKSGGTATALDILDHYRRAVADMIDHSDAPGWASKMVEMWADVTGNLRTDWSLEFGRIDWVTKLVRLSQQLERMGFGWQEFSRWTYTLGSVRRLKATFPELDLRAVGGPAGLRRSALGTLEEHFAKQGLSWTKFPGIWEAASLLCQQCLRYHFLDPARNLSHADAHPGLVPAERVDALRAAPPQGTRASVRGEAIRTAPPGATAGWTFVDHGSRRLVMGDPFGAGASWHTTEPKTMGQESRT